MVFAGLRQLLGVGEIDLRKLGILRGEAEEPAAYPDVYGYEEAGGIARLRITCSRGLAALVLALGLRLRPPYDLLYILVVPRGGSAAGRYQSPPLAEPQVTALFREFGTFWSEDSRHHVWIHSGLDNATVAWNRHDVIYAYGPIAELVAVLEARGIARGAVSGIPVPHVHYYHPEWDAAERDLVAKIAWQLKALRPEDEE